ncbi:MAG: hypothetical protein F6K00_30400 [Leptolyngbya sp. SIOISBB]|nr:hypothetical protein [Leptolyngbya sp. SIOISBB]
MLKFVLAQEMQTLLLLVIAVMHDRADFIGHRLTALVPKVEALGSGGITIASLSNTGSAEIIRQFLTVKLVGNPEQSGFSANNNYGMAVDLGPPVLLSSNMPELETHCPDFVWHSHDSNRHCSSDYCRLSATLHNKLSDRATFPSTICAAIYGNF